MNIQRPIGKPGKAQSLLAIRKGAAASTSSQTSRESKMLDPKSSQIVSVSTGRNPSETFKNQQLGLMANTSLLAALQKRNKGPTAKSRTPWKLHRVIQGHQGWVRTVDVDPSNEWFATGGTDRMIKIWDLATGVLRVTLVGHTHNVRAVKVHPQLKYLFSVGEDNMVKCWDLEANKVIRHYHGHVGGVYCLDVHPSDNFLFTGSRDTSVRMWDIRTRECVHVLSGHTHTVQAVKAQATAPELISGSTDATVRLWDIRRAGRSYQTLTHHQKGIRSISILNTEFATCAADCVKIWKSPNGDYERDMSTTGILNCSTVRDDGLFVTGSDDGTLCLYDWESGSQFQTIKSPPQPGSMECENAIFDSTFDYSGTRLITAECDKTIKIYREDDTVVNA